MILAVLQVTVLCALTWLLCQVLKNTGAFWQRNLVAVCLLMCLTMPILRWVPVEYDTSQHWQAVKSITPSLVDEVVAAPLAFTPIDDQPEVQATGPGVESALLRIIMWFWIAGCAIVLGKRLAEILSLWRAKQTASYLCEYGGLAVLTSAVVDVPLLCVIGRPVILLPEKMRHWDKQQLSHVFEHECCHHRRKDHWYLMLSIVAGVIYWFHPLVHWLNRHLKQQMELACDQQLLKEGMDRITYAETLLACVSDVNQPHMITMATQPNLVKHRIEAVLQDQQPTISRGRKFLVSCLSTSLLVGCVDLQVQAWVGADEMVDVVGHDLPSIRTKNPDKGEVLLSVFYDGVDDDSTQIRFKLSNGEANSWLTLGPLKKFNRYIHTWHLQLKNHAHFTGEYEVIGVTPDGVVDGVAVGLIGTDLNGRFTLLKSKSHVASDIPNIMCSWPLGLYDEELIPSLPQLTEDNPDSVRRLLCGAQLVNNGIHQLN